VRQASPAARNFLVSGASVSLRPRRVLIRFASLLTDDVKQKLFRECSRFRTAQFSGPVTLGTPHGKVPAFYDVVTLVLLSRNLNFDLVHCSVQFGPTPDRRLKTCQASNNSDRPSFCK
jgi:hypothetical protein